MISLAENAHRQLQSALWEDERRETKLPPRLLVAFQEDDLKDAEWKAADAKRRAPEDRAAAEKRAEEERKAAEKRAEADRVERERSECLERVSRMISGMSFGERVLFILTDQDIKKWNFWDEAWSICTDQDIEILKAADVQKLIDLCEGDISRWRWKRVLVKLRHQMRLLEVEHYRRQYGQMAPRDQLRLLVQNRTVPIEHYPEELSQHVSPEWLKTLTVEERDHFAKLLNDTRLRVWKEVRERCRGDGKMPNKQL